VSGNPIYQEGPSIVINSVNMAGFSKLSCRGGLNLQRVALALVALLPIRVVAPPQQPGASVRLIKGDDAPKLEKNLNEAAAEGYRLSRVDSARVLNAVANLFLSGSHEDTSGAFIVMEKSPAGSGKLPIRSGPFIRSAVELGTRRQ
jgi:hypothetical protein